MVSAGDDAVDDDLELAGFFEAGLLSVEDDPEVVAVVDYSVEFGGVEGVFAGDEFDVFGEFGGDFVGVVFVGFLFFFLCRVGAEAFEEIYGVVFFFLRGEVVVFFFFLLFELVSDLFFVCEGFYGFRGEIV